MTSTDFTISDVLAWARTKPAGVTYCYADSSNCALCQFLRETDRATRPGVMPHVGGFPEYGYWMDDASPPQRYPYPAELEPALEAKGSGDRTFGALAARLEALEPKSAWTRSDAYLNDLELAKM